MPARFGDYRSERRGFEVGVEDRSETARAEEYGALGAELRSLRNRSIAILGGALAVSSVAVWRWLEFVQGSKDTHAHMVALFVAFFVASAMAITYKLYEDGFRIAAYVEVFHEDRVPGWHSRDRRVRDFIRGRGGVQRRSLANLLEPRLLAYLYLPLVVTAGLLILASPLTAVRTWSLAPAALALGLGTYLFLELGFFLDRRDDWWRWWWKEYMRLEGTKPDLRTRAPRVPQEHDPAMAMIGLLLLELMILFLLGLLFQAPIALPLAK
jgi:hypothetical protein